MPGLFTSLRGLTLPVAFITAGLTIPAVAAQEIVTRTASASDAFQGYKGYLNLPVAQRNLFNVYYIVRIKNAAPGTVTAELLDQGKVSPIHFASDGRVSPLPTRDQLNRGAKVVFHAPKQASYAMKVRVFSTQPIARDYDAAGLAAGVRQANTALTHIAGIMAMAVPKLDRVYFPGGVGGTVRMSDGKEMPLPKALAGDDYPAGTPYFVPAKMPSAAHITLTKAPEAAMLAVPPS
jgi:hypothetical protein